MAKQSVRPQFQQDSEIFRQYAELIALDFELPLRSDDDFQHLFEALASRLDSYRIKKSAVKKGRWFSWHNGCQDHHAEYFATRMLLSWGYPNEPNPDDSSKSLNELRAAGDSLGGLKLGLQCMSFKSWYGITMLKLADEPLWSHYTDLAKNVKDPSQGLARCMSSSGDAWMAERQFTDLVGVLLQDDEFDKVRSYSALSLNFLGDDAARQEKSFVVGMWDYTLQLLGFRARTMSRYSVGPETYSKILEGDEETKTLMRADWRMLRLLESSPGREAQALAGDLGDAVSKPLRLAFQLLEVGLEGETVALLKSLLTRQPDTKVVEDIHQRLRVEALANANKKLLPRELQSLVYTSNQVEARSIPHPARLNKEAFLQQWKVTKPDYNFKLSFDSGVVKLPKYFSRMLAKKTWRTLNEESLAFSSSAWAWMRHYVSKDLKSNGIVLKDAKRKYYIFVFGLCLPRRTKLVRHIINYGRVWNQSQDAQMCMVLQSGMAFRDLSDDRGAAYICLCNLRWAVLAWPLLQLGGDQHILDPAGQVSWHFVLRADEFEAAIAQPSFVPGVGIGCELTEWQPALQVVLKEFSGKLLFRELEALAKSCGMKKTGGMSRWELLSELAFAVGGPDFAEEVKESAPNDRKRKVDEAGFDDLAELLLEAMDKDEAAEFSDVKTQLTKKQKSELTSRWQKWRKEAET